MGYKCGLECIVCDESYIAMPAGLCRSRKRRFKELARHAKGQSEPAARICQKSSGRSLLRWEDSRASPALSPSLLPQTSFMGMPRPSKV